MRTILTFVLCIGLLVGLTACATAEPEPAATPPAGSDPAAGTSLAAPEGAVPGVTELDDGTIEAEGWLAYVDIEGGFYALQDGPASDTPDVVVDVGTVVVIANSADLTVELEGLRGAYVRATGEMLDGASIRMAGPEMRVNSIELAQ